MRDYKTIPKLFLLFFTALLMVLTFNTTTVKALNQTDLENAEKVMRKYDGINNWQLKSYSPSNDYDTIPIGGNISIGYAFGSVRDANGNVKAGDNTITKASTVGNINGAPTVNNSKINIFLDYNGKYYGILHQNKDAYVGGSNPGAASDTSIDFAFPTGNSDSYFYKDMNLLYKLSVFDSSSNSSKLFYVGTDSNKKKVFKLVGYYGPKDVYVEIVLRPSPSGSPVIQRELYVYNGGSSTAQIQPFYGEDTGLNPNNDDQTVDNVPMFAIGGGQGLYLLSGSNYNPASKLFVTNNVDGGFQDFMGRVLTNPTNWGVKGKVNNTGSNISDPSLPWVAKPSSSQVGDTKADADADLLKGSNYGREYDIVDGNGKQDTAYTLRWPQENLEVGQVNKYVSNIGATISGYAIPNVKKTYTNATSTDGKNHVGDKLNFTLTVRNDGYNSNWQLTRILDELPKGLTIDPNSVNTSMANGDTIDFNPGASIPDKASTKYTFSATINNQAPYYLTDGKLTNTAKFTGNNKGQSDSKTYEASVDIPVETPTFKYRFTKQVRNNTNDPNGAFASQTTAKQGDIIDYEVQFISNGTSNVTGGNFKDDLPAGLELVPGSVALNGVKQNDLNFSLGTLSNTITNKITFQAKVTAIDATTASNTAYMTNIITNTGQQYSKIQTEAPAIVNIEVAPQTTSFVEVPTSIDFGSVNMTDSERILPNVKTTGNLIINHTAETPFQVSVSYDNNNAPLTNGSDKLINDNDDAMFFHQASNESNNWRTVSTSPVPIKSEGFSGQMLNQSLNDFIGAKKWKLRVPANSKSGKYTGQVTWTIADTIN
ncbi:hypothetical protein C5L30_001671 [Companilactobacillus farciminis]|uniref:DUF11 domain-containing protein n=1 Tax=Companilactobacillus farciminis TaxID=1612 RepID=A0A4R5NED5_9LACO|nr:DUF11 domain-containing protein [Companilactobacillus farciminis]ATO46961.1 hypothetical protein LF20184_09520 [Companilactobacillus farciminis KCTC 3681 = DSM 20184]KRK61180.1 cell surface protein precursor [Companilactobacillus farciminis KCTC 3681 = DSM 20184]TDG71974.1 hypothetical protein C5L30_001671 [Companilactobacillus farciminis]